ncbi:MAG: hypothetical protein AAFV53_15130 [Myxococcota bacterium]
MRRSTFIVATLVGGLSIGALLLWMQDPSPASPALVGVASPDAEPDAVADPSLAGVAPIAVPDAMERLAALHGPQPPASEAETRARLQARRETVKNLEIALAAGGAGAVDGIVSWYLETDTLRERKFLIRSLSRNRSEQAADALAELYDSEERIADRHDLARALALSEAPGSQDALRANLETETDERIRLTLIQGAYGDAMAMDRLTEIVWESTERLIQQEALHSIGGVGTEAARSVLEQAASDAGLSALVRQFAEKEIGRSFGE